MERHFPIITILCFLLAACAGNPPAPPPDAAEVTDFSAEEEMLTAEAPPEDEVFEALVLKCDATYRQDELWDRIRAGFALPGSDHPRVISARNWYANHQAYLDRVTTRARPYLHYIVEEVEARGMPLEIALLPVVESAFDPYAYSHGRAAGLWQFIPGTGKRYGLIQNWWVDGRRDVIESTRAALDYLEDLHAEFDDWLLALAAYNTGEGNVRRAIRRNRAAGRPIDFFSLSLPRETRGYAPKLLALRDLVSDPGGHGIALESIANAPYLGVVEFDSQIDLALAAELAGMPLDELYLLNPGYNHWATDPQGPHRLVLPLDYTEDFARRVAEVPPAERVSWQRYRVRRGDALSTIARRHRTTVAALQRANELDGTLIRAGQHLLIPAASRPPGAYKLSAPQRLAATQATQRDGQRFEYTVRRGDSLWQIGREHGVGVRNLAGWNGMAPTDVLREGQKLVIWMPGDRTAATSGARDTMRQLTYTVRRGDSLSRISQRFRVSVNDLRRWNALHGQRYIQPGQRLVLYVDVTMQSGGR